MTRRRRRVGRFESAGPLAVSQVPDDPGTWEITAPIVFHSATGYTLRVEPGSRTDWASVWRLLSWLIGQMTGAAAAAAHDDCWRRKIPAGEMTYRQADALFEEMLAALDQQAAVAGRRQDRIPAPVRWLAWDAVRIASITTRRGGAKEAWRDLPRMALITPIGLLLAAPAVALLPSTLLLGAANYLDIRLSKGTPHA